ncbi:MAG: sterol desaturase family protein [Pseudomonadota bacterium]
MPFEINDTTLRLFIFLSVFLAMSLLELCIPKRKLKSAKAKRWTTNIMIAGIDSFCVRLMGLVALPLVAITAAEFAQTQSWGIFHITNWPYWLEFILTLIVLDCAIYIQHVASHKIPILWRLHKMHHSDTDIDVSTAVRFHPIEIMLSMLYKVIVVFILGPAVLAVFVFEVILNACAMFNHANITIPSKIEKALRLFVVTPDMHRVHHSAQQRETDSNFGFNLSLWDHLFSTYTAEPKLGHQGMTIGLNAHQSKAPSQLLWSLLLPFAQGKNEKL